MGSPERGIADGMDKKGMFVILLMEITDGY